MVNSDPVGMRARVRSTAPHLLGSTGSRHQVRLIRRVEEHSRDVWSLT